MGRRALCDVSLDPGARRRTGVDRATESAKCAHEAAHARRARRFFSRVLCRGVFLYAVVATSLASMESPVITPSPRRSVVGARRSPRQSSSRASPPRHRREPSRPPPRHRRRAVAATSSSRASPPRRRHKTKRRLRRRRRLGPLRPARRARRRDRARDYGRRVRRHGRLPGDGPRGRLAAERRRVAAAGGPAVAGAVQAHLFVVRRRRGAGAASVSCLPVVRWRGVGWDDEVRRDHRHAITATRPYLRPRRPRADR